MSAPFLLSFFCWILSASSSADCCAGSTVLASCFGYVDGSTSSLSVQRAIACGGGKTVVVDNVAGSDGVWSTPPLFINASVGGDGLALVIAAGVTLQAARGLYRSRSDCLVTVSGVTGVSITGSGGPGSSSLRMWQSDYANATLYNHSEWRHALSLLGAVGTTVTGLAMSESGGDGISINERCVNITLRDLNLTANFRNAMSVCGIEGLVVERCLFARSAGTCCQSGIDFEPGTPAEVVKGVVVRDSIFEHNAMNQLSIALYAQDAVVDDLLFDNCTFRHSAWSAVSLSGFDATSPLGRVVFRNCAVYNISDKGFVIDRRADTGALVALENVSISETGSWPIVINGGGVTLANVSVTQLRNSTFLYAGWNHHVLPGVNNTNGTATVYSPYAHACVPVYNPANSSVNNHIVVSCLPIASPATL